MSSLVSIPVSLSWMLGISESTRCDFVLPIPHVVNGLSLVGAAICSDIHTETIVGGRLNRVGLPQEIAIGIANHHADGIATGIRGY
jgi:hypothetical protein